MREAIRVNLGKYEKPDVDEVRPFQQQATTPNLAQSFIHANDLRFVQTPLPTSSSWLMDKASEIAINVSGVSVRKGLLFGLKEQIFSELPGAYTVGIYN